MPRPVPPGRRWPQSVGRWRPRKRSFQGTSTDLRISQSPVQTAFMATESPDKKPAMNAATDRGEAVDLMEPLRVGASAAQRTELTDLAVELASASATLRSALPEGVVSALATLLRAMNCYYSNLIEGHERKRGRILTEQLIAVTGWLARPCHKAVLSRVAPFSLTGVAPGTARRAPPARPRAPRRRSVRRDHVPCREGTPRPGGCHIARHGGSLGRGSVRHLEAVQRPSTAKSEALAIPRHGG